TVISTANTPSENPLSAPESVYGARHIFSCIEAESVTGTGSITMTGPGLGATKSNCKVGCRSVGTPALLSMKAKGGFGVRTARFGCRHINDRFRRTGVAQRQSRAPRGHGPAAHVKK